MRTRVTRDRLLNLVYVGGASLSVGISNLVIFAASARLLSPSDFGALAALLALVTVLSTVGAAAQAISARKRALGVPIGLQSTSTSLVLLGIATSLGFALPTSWLLGIPLGIVLLAMASIVPIWGASPYLGFLQGAGSFPAWSLSLAIGAVARSGLAVLSASLFGTIAGVVSGLLLGSILSLPLPVLLARAKWRGLLESGSIGLGEILGVSGQLLLFLTLMNLDVILARFFLSALEAGTYAVGSIITKLIVFISFPVLMYVYPYLAGEHRKRALRWSSAAVFGLSTIGTLASAVFPVTISHAIAGNFITNTPVAYWPFALMGFGWSLGQLFLYFSIANSQRRLTLVLVPQIVVSILLFTLWHNSILEVISVAIAVSLLSAAVGAGSATRYLGASRNMGHSFESRGI